MIFNILNTIVLLGALQGFIFSFLLIRNSKGKTSENVLAVILILMSLAALNIYLSEAFPIWQVDVFLSLMPTILIMAIGPLIYFYIRFSIGESTVWKRSYNYHFLPVCIDLLPTVCAWLLVIGFFSDFFTQDNLLQWGAIIDQYNTYTDIPRWVSITIYLLISKNLYQKMRNQDSGKSQAKNGILFNWLKRFIHVFLWFQAGWLVFLVFYINPSTRFTLLEIAGYYPLFIPLTFLIYTLGIKGFLATRSEFAKSLKTYQSIQLSQAKTNSLLERIRHAMESEKLFLNSSLSLEELVNYVKSDQRTVSYILNKHLNKSFNSFVNDYRLEEVKRMMVDPTFQHLNISGLAFEAGFNSVSTFQRVFKQATDQTPKEYLLSQQLEKP